MWKNKCIESGGGGGRWRKRDRERHDAEGNFKKPKQTGLGKRDRIDRTNLRYFQQYSPHYPPTCVSLIDQCLIHSSGLTSTQFATVVWLWILFSASSRKSLPVHKKWCTSCSQHLKQQADVFSPTLSGYRQLGNLAFFFFFFFFFRHMVF